MSMKWECWAYKNGKPDKMTYVCADSKNVAEQLAWEKFQNQLGINPEHVTVK